MPVRLAAAVVLACVIASAVLGSMLAHRQSATNDEVAHIAAGVMYTQGDYRLNREHPPLVKWLAGMALSLPEPPVLREPFNEGTQWVLGHAILHSGPPGQALQRVADARMPMVWLAALCPLLVALFAHRIAGPLAAAAAALFAACCPLWYAHGTLVTTDAAVSLFTLAAALCAHRLLTDTPGTQPAGWSWVLGLAASVGLGVASKYSMLLSVAGLGLAALWTALATRRPRALVVIWLVLALSTLTCAALCWGWPPSLSGYLEGVGSIGFNHSEGYPFYAFGEYFTGVGSRPLYFASALLVKVEWSLLLPAALGVALLAVALAPNQAEAHTRAQADFVVLTLVPAVYLAVVSLRAPALGVRYVLPVVPFLFVLAGVAAAKLAQSMAGRLSLVAAVALELLALTQAFATSPIAWFNGVPCRTGQTPACLDDSNVDWGQSLPALASHRDANYPGEALRVFSFVQSPLGAYMPKATRAEPLEIARPYRAVYAASLHSLVRMPQASAFARARPTAVIAGSMAIFDLRSILELPPPPP